MNSLRIAALAILASSISLAVAQDKKPDAAAQKSAADENFKRLDIKDGSSLETKQFLLYGSIPQAKLKDLASTLEKQYALAYKTLNFEKDGPWNGRLAVYVLSERSEFASFYRTVVRMPLSGDDADAADLRSDFPYVAAGEPRTTEKGVTPEFRVQQRMLSAMLSARAGSSARPPEWLRNGFAWSIMHRTTPTQRSQSERALMRNLVPSRSLKDLWSGERPAREVELLGASLADYLAFSPDMAKTNALVELASAYRPNEQGDIPGHEAALETAKLNWMALEAGWKKFARVAK